MAKRGWTKLAGAAAALMLGSSMAQAVSVTSPYPSPMPRPSGTPIPPSGPRTVFDFTGVCDDCQSLDAEAGNTITAQLTLAGYTLGQTIDFSNFVSLVYDGSNRIPTGFGIDNTNATGLGGSINSPNGPASFYASDFFGDLFETSVTGQWNVVGPTPLDQGTTSTYALEGAVSPVPEAATWALLILGLGAVGVRARHRRGGVAAVHA